MGNEFAFVEQGLEEVKKGDPNRAEIHSAISDFKDALVIACKNQYKRDVSFEPLFYGIPGSPSGRFGWGQDLFSKINNGDVTVYCHGLEGLQIFRYELDPILGYPVTLSYNGKIVRCSDREELIAAIRDAYGRSVGSLKDFCETGTVSLPLLSGLHRLGLPNGLIKTNIAVNVK